MIHRLTNHHSEVRVINLQTQHLAIVRAALTLWDEEMASEQEEVYRHYLHSKDLGTLITPIAVAEARAYFNDVDLKFTLFDIQTGGLVSSKLAESCSELSCLHGQQIVSVLVR